MRWCAGMHAYLILSIHGVGSCFLTFSDHTGWSMGERSVSWGSCMGPEGWVSGGAQSYGTSLYNAHHTLQTIGDQTKNWQRYTKTVDMLQYFTCREEICNLLYTSRSAISLYTSVTTSSRRCNNVTLPSLSMTMWCNNYNGKYLYNFITMMW